MTIFGIDSNDLLGDFSSIATGDFNGDGRQDILLGASNADGPGNSRPDAGEGYIIFSGVGVPSSLDLADFPGPGVRIYGSDIGDNLGCGVASGDVNGDKIDDIIISSCGGDGPNNDRFGLGEVYIILGRPNLPSVIDLLSSASYDTIIYGLNTQERFGIALGTADLNGDNIDDIVIGAPDADGWRAGRPDAGAAFIVFGSLNLPSVIDLRTARYPHVAIYGANPGDHLGEAVATTDVNGDGISDVLVGAPDADGAGGALPDAGAAYLIYGRENWPAEIDLGAAAADVALFGRDAGDRFGSSVLIADLDGDGFEDLIAGAPEGKGPDNLRGGAGEVYVIYGAEGFPPVIDLAQASSGIIIFGQDPRDALGSALASGDVNGDGLSDLLIGAKGADGPNKRADAGEAYLIYGGELPAQLDLLRQGPDVVIYGASPLDKLGSGLWSGDVNGDGTDDILVGAVGADGPKDRIPDAGEVYIIYGIAKPQHPPVADAGPDQAVIKGVTVQLDGSGSFDPDGDRLRFTWSFISKPEESLAVLSDPANVRPTFLADAVGRYVVQLQVEDGRGGVDTDEVQIIVMFGLKGDVDLDGDVDIIDAQWAAEYIVCLRELNEIQRYNADVRSPCRPPERHVDVTDVRWIAEYTIGLVSEMGCYESEVGSAEGAGRVVSVELESKAIPSGSTGKIGLFLTDGLGEVVDLQVGPQGALLFDPKIVQLRGIRGLGPYRVLAERIDNTDGRAQFVLIALDREAARGRGPIAELEVAVTSAGGGSTRLELTGVDILRDLGGTELGARVINGTITVERTTGLMVRDIRAIPNPVKNSDAVTFSVEGSGIAEIAVEIFDLSGRTVFTSGWVGNAFEWHLLNTRGQIVANGVYLYLVTVRGLDGALLHSGVRKLVVLR
ncbi:MAG: PKD domain-containing protein [Candidatus Acetothermia bacterium]|nr:PKD domain-containing protein [Candidatus Acetothermia bacterium]MDH7506001.1 PKD domain-containing protein [Candidatus Acetothermia bacterium]